MPEGPEVRIFADCLSILIDHNITKILYSDRCAEKFKVFNEGDKLIDVYSYGKKLIFKLLRNGEEYHLSNSVIMTGRWSYNQEQTFDMKLTFKDQNDRYVDLWYYDSRHMSLFEFGEESNLISHVGPDWLQGVEYPIFYELITRKRIGHMEICNFLMNQSYTSGIGNYLKSEILFEARLHPQQSLGSLTEEIIEDLYHIINETIHKSYECGGLTIQTYYDPFGRLGTFDTKVYGHKEIIFFGKSYKVITNTFSDKRTSHYIPEIQTLF